VTNQRKSDMIPALLINTFKSGNSRTILAATFLMESELLTTPLTKSRVKYEKEA
jgi:hypothetical protein